MKRMGNQKTSVWGNRREKKIARYQATDPNFCGFFFPGVELDGGLFRLGLDFFCLLFLNFFQFLSTRLAMVRDGENKYIAAAIVHTTTTWGMTVAIIQQEKN